MNIEKYAPVVIPTLNRFDHFQKCLESLEKCMGAEQTDVFVAVDYPPSDKYKEGWLQINKYLETKEKNNKFKNLFIIRRESNLGVCNENANDVRLIYDEIYPNYDRFIYTEDDNVFSPCFLDYVNKGLELSKSTNIEFVSGYRHLDMVIDADYSSNYFISKAFSAWGFAVMVDKHKAFDEYQKFDKIRKILKNKEQCKKIEQEKPGAVGALLGMLKHHQIHGDTMHSIYMILNDKYCLFPSLSKVTNCGADGTGVHSVRVNQSQLQSFLNQERDKNKTFDFVKGPNGIKVFQRIRANTKPHNIRTTLKYLILKFDFALFRITGKTINSKYI